MKVRLFTICSLMMIALIIWMVLPENNSEHDQPLGHILDVKDEDSSQQAAALKQVQNRQNPVLTPADVLLPHPEAMKQRSENQTSADARDRLPSGQEPKSLTQENPTPSETREPTKTAEQALDPKLILIKPEEQWGLISWKQTGAKESETSSANWTPFCQSLGSSITTRGLRPGFLIGFTCAGLNSKPLSPLNPLWHIELSREKAEELRVRVTFQSAQDLKPVLDYVLAIHSDERDIFKNLRLAEVLGRLMLEQLPTGWKLKIDDPEQPLIIESSVHDLGFPEKILLFDLAYNSSSKVWIPVLRGTLVRQERKEDRKGLRQETYRLGAAFTPLKPQSVYWAQNIKGPSQRPRDNQNYVRNALPGFSLTKLLGSLLLNPLDSQFIGLRYGRSILRGATINAKTELFSILGEMRSGPLKGLRWYYDMTPEVRQGTERFRINQGSLGWAFTFGLPLFMQPFFERLDVQPKLGLLDVRSNLNYPIANGRTSSISFEGRNIINLSMEVGLEKDLHPVRVRGWGRISSARFGLFQESGISIDKQSFGLDLTYRIFSDQQQWNVSLLGFSQFELLRLANKNENIDQYSADNLGIRMMTFNLFFMGGGLTLSW